MTSFSFLAEPPSDVIIDTFTTSGFSVYIKQHDPSATSFMVTAKSHCVQEVCNLTTSAVELVCHMTKLTPGDKFAVEVVACSHGKTDCRGIAKMDAWTMPLRKSSLPLVYLSRINVQMGIN